MNKKIIRSLMAIACLGMESFLSLGAQASTDRESELSAQEEQQELEQATELLEPEQAMDGGAAAPDLAAIIRNRMKIALVLNIQESIRANAALKQSVLAHDQKIAELELIIEKKQQNWFDWAASFFKAAEPKKLRSMHELEGELAAATAGYLINRGDPTRFDLPFLAMARKKQKLYETELKAIIDKQKQEIDQLKSQL